MKFDGTEVFELQKKETSGLTMPPEVRGYAYCLTAHSTEVWIKIRNARFT